MIRSLALALGILAFAVNPALAGFLINSFAIAPAGASITFVGCTEASNDAAVYTYTNHATGTAAADRATIIGIASEDSTTVFDVSSVTVGGNAAAEVVDQGGSLSLNTAIYIISNTSGTTATIVVNLSEAITSNTVCVWAAYGLNSLTAVGTNSTSGSGTHTLDVSATGGGVAVGIASQASNVPTSTWTGLAEGADTTGTDFAWSAASAQTPTTGTFAITQAWSGGVSRNSASASFR